MMGIKHTLDCPIGVVLNYLQVATLDCSINVGEKANLEIINVGRSISLTMMRIMWAQNPSAMNDNITPHPPLVMYMP